MTNLDTHKNAIIFCILNTMSKRLVTPVNRMAWQCFRTLPTKAGLSYQLTVVLCTIEFPRQIPILNNCWSKARGIMTRRLQNLNKLKICYHTVNICIHLFIFNLEKNPALWGFPVCVQVFFDDTKHINTI